MATDAELRKIFTDICRGHSRANWGKNDIFIKHLSHSEQADLEFERESFFKKAREQKIPTLDEKNQWLIKEGLWSKENDKRIRDFTEYGKELSKSKAKAAIQVQKNDFDRLINENQIELNRLISEKNNLIGLTAESYADSRIYNNYPYYSFFKDKECEERFFTKKKYDNLDDEEVYDLLDIYINFVKTISIENIKKISISQFFTSFFYISDDLSKFFGKPLYELTFSQVNLITYGSYFKNIISSLGESLTDELRSDPDKLEDFANRKSNSNISQKESKNGYTMVIGATEKNDGKILGGAKRDVFDKGEIDTAWGGVKSGQIKLN